MKNQLKIANERKIRNLIKKNEKNLSLSKKSEISTKFM